MLPAIIPIFPLPNVVLFPSVFLPLHIFEPRYRQMLTDALRGDRIIGMVLTKEHQKPSIEAPAVYSSGAPDSSATPRPCRTAARILCCAAWSAFALAGTNRTDSIGEHTSSLYRNR